MGDSKASYFYIDKSLDDLKFIEPHTKGIRYMDSAANDLLIYSVCFKFVQVSESAKNSGECAQGLSKRPLESNQRAKKQNRT